jgi:hypothetical protein
MNPRYQPGGDKYEDLRNDDRRAFYERVQIEQEEIISALKTVVRCWTENEMEAGNNPTFENFIHYYREWDHEELHETIGEEMFRTKHGLSNIGQAI